MSTDRVVTTATADPDGVTITVLQHVLGVESRIHDDGGVCVVPPEPADELWRQLRDGDLPVHRIGGCLAPRRAHAAIVEGHRVGTSL